MKFLSFITLLTPVFTFATSYLRGQSDVIDYNLTPNLIDKFQLWARVFDIKFENMEKYYNMYEKWIHNEEYIQKINEMNLSYTLDHNQFSGMDENDFRGYIIRNSEFEHHRQTPYSFVYLSNTTFEALPSSVNWVSAGAVTGVKDQGQCGSCWSFSTTGALEGVYFIKNGKQLSFSEQQLVDCDNLKNGGRDHGCNGGLMDNAFSWIHKNGGLCQEVDYPYTSGTGVEGTCKTTCSLVKGSQIVSYVDVPPSNDNEMMTALVKQPVSIAIEADTRDFQLYKSGVFTSSTCGTNLDHGVLAVGYGTENGQNYYLVKNSWGTSWGEKGYIKLGRGAQYNSGDGQCGMLLEASYPLL